MNIKKIYLVIVLNSLFINLQSQNFEWAKEEGLWAYDYGYGISTDQSGNVYVAGKYEMAANFSGVILPDRGNHDIYVAQYSPTGTLNWIKTAGGNMGDYAHAMTCDGVNYVYVVGEMENTIVFDASPITLTSMGDNDIFIAKYDLNGTLLWATNDGGYGNDRALGVTYDAADNVYICGMFSGTATFGATTINSQGGKDMFVAKYDSNGNFQWVRHGGSAGRDEGLSIKCDTKGNVYICGFYSDAASFDTQLLNSPNGYYNTFLAKYTADGTLSWIKTAGGDYDDVAWSLTLDNSDKIYITGEFNAYALFDATPLTTLGNADIFVACYDTSGNVQWAKGAGGALIDRARGIGSDGNNIYITGQFGDSASFGSFSLTAADSSDVFMAALNNAGDFLWASSVGGPADSIETLSYESGNAICAETSGNVYATGALLDGGAFGSSSFNEIGRTDAFITKISQNTVNILSNNSMKQIHLYPNPSRGIFKLEIQSGNLKINNIEIYNVMGQKIYDINNYQNVASVSQEIFQIDLSDRKKGIYFILISAEGETVMRDKIIIQD